MSCKYVKKHATCTVTVPINKSYIGPVTQDQYMTCLRRWTNINPTQDLCWVNVGPASQTVVQH